MTGEMSAIVFAVAGVTTGTRTSAALDQLRVVELDELVLDEHRIGSGDGSEIRLSLAHRSHRVLSVLGRDEASDEVGAVAAGDRWCAGGVGKTCRRPRESKRRATTRGLVRDILRAVASGGEDQHADAHDRERSPHELQSYGWAAS